MKRLAVRAIAVWLVMIAAESIHGVARALLLAPRVGDFRSRQIGVLTGSAIILAIAWLFSSWIGARTKRELLEVGLAWFGLTVLFEMGLGIFVLGYPWERLLADYDLSHGGLLLAGMALLTLSPLIAFRLRSYHKGEWKASSGTT